MADTENKNPTWEEFVAAADDSTKQAIIAQWQKSQEEKTHAPSSAQRDTSAIQMPGGGITPAAWNDFGNFSAHSSMKKTPQEIAEEFNRNRMDWYGPEYDKHIAMMRGRIPLLTSLWMKDSDNPNMRNLAQTNKWARLADAHNAQLLYRAGGDKSDGTFDGAKGTNAPSYEAPPKLETQDQKQMDQLREAQADLRKWGLEQESHYGQDYYKRKMDEMQAYLAQDQKNRFFESEEQMRRTAEIFNLWKSMSETEFNEYLSKIRIGAEQRNQIYELIQQGRYNEAMIVWERWGGTPASIEQLEFNHATEGAMGKFMRGEIGHEAAFIQLSTMKAEALISQVTSMINYAKTQKQNGMIAKAVADLEAGIGKLAETAGGILKESDKIAVIGGILAALQMLGGAIGSVIPECYR